MSQPYLSISRVDMAFTRGGVTNPVLKDVNLDIQRGEYISLIGHSGCGKSTVLNIVAGLLRANGIEASIFDAAQAQANDSTAH